MPNALERRLAVVVGAVSVALELGGVGFAAVEMVVRLRLEGSM